ncbi:hypothetical protein JHK87_042704 [Glycine soja]|nr:hypothetical protein JHK87_042704 [Glycine soja]
MAVEMGTGVPWVMCKEDDAPDQVVRKFLVGEGKVQHWEVTEMGWERCKNSCMKVINASWASNAHSASVGGKEETEDIEVFGKYMAEDIEVSEMYRQKTLKS